MTINKKDKYIVSAIVSTYNSEEYIGPCLKNLEAQTIADKLEIIVIDSASEENEKRIIDDFIKKYSNIKYIRTEKRETLYAAWNRGINASSGKYICNTNTDDRLKNDALEIMSKTLEVMEHAGIVYADQIITNYPNETFEMSNICGFFKRGAFSVEDLIARSSCGSQVMWRRSLHEMAGYFKDDYEVLGDWEFWLRCVFNTPFTAYHIPEILGSYYSNVKGLELGTRKQEEMLKEAGEIKKGYCEKTKYARCSIFINYEKDEEILKNTVFTIIKSEPSKEYHLVIFFREKKKPSFLNKIIRKAKKYIKTNLIFSKFYGAGRENVSLDDLSCNFHYLKFLKTEDDNIGGRYLALMSGSGSVRKEWFEEALRLFDNDQGDIGIMSAKLAMKESSEDAQASSIDYFMMITADRLRGFLKKCPDEFNIKDIKTCRK